ncbi:UNVERIFIED_CONTAM: hypothetical protein GTU68_044832 [Idotea baltica]|nr:hypothetical protein [Idotea baltica]
MTLIIAKFPTALITVAGLLIISREIIITALREWMAGLGKRSVVAVSNIGKWKTGMQITALIMLCFNYGLYGHILGQFFLIVAAVLTLWSMVTYLKAAFKDMDVLQ